MAHSLSNFIVRQHKNKKIADGKNKKKGEAKSTTKDIYAGEATEVVTSSKVNGKAAKDEWDGEEWAESDSEDEADQMAKLSLMEMKPSMMSSAQKGEAFEMYIDQLVNDGSIVEMMKAKEKIMQIVLKAEYYGLKQKGKINGKSYSPSNLHSSVLRSLRKAHAEWRVCSGHQEVPPAPCLHQQEHGRDSRLEVDEILHLRPRSFP